VPWLSRRRSEAGREQAAEEVQTVQEALQSLEQDIARAHARTAVISEISRTLRRLGERNHFAPMIKDALGGKFR
jgi:soluble lytic murein transglycosylase-like protein